ncbi:helix-turn-helix transcriptional regulator [Streptomyces melanogenes]|uniref:Helix-turn-helix domain-containing protein n=1 Tax=Streptomyces melanogenes TaxID=67326 RepID=A0ABZ1XNE4_9ACTN|nr:helix-turn-helix transcriptional regulator [Streptomyces melanogenes]
MHSHDRPSDVIAEQVRRHRTRLGLNREQLAERCAELGAPELTYSALVDIENGRKTKEGKRRRHVTVDELLVLGLALAVPPLLLACPLDTAQPVPSVPAAEPQAPYTLWKWATGQEAPAIAGPIDGRHHVDPRPIGDNGPRWATAWAAAAYPASLHPEFEKRREAAHRAYLRMERADADKDAQTDYFQRLDDLAGVADDMARSGLPVPRLREDWIEDMRGLGMLDASSMITPEETNA